MSEASERPGGLSELHKRVLSGVVMGVAAIAANLSLMATGYVFGGWIYGR